MLSLKLALRNIPAHGQRNLIIGAVTALVTALLFLMLSYADGAIDNVRHGLSGIAAPTGDLQINHGDYWFARERGQDLRDKTVDRWPEVVAAARSVKGVKEAVPGFPVWYDKLSVGGKGYSGFNPIAISGEDSARHALYTLVEGRDIAVGDHKVVLLHASARDALHFPLGADLMWTGNDAWGQLTSVHATLIGYFRPNADNPNLYTAALVDPDTLAEIVGYTSGVADRVVVRLERGADPALVRAALTRVLPGLDVRDAEHVDFGGYEQIYGGVKLLLIVMSWITLLVTGFGIMNVVSANLYDRRKEIGTLYCLGTERPFLRRMYTWEIVLVNLGGAAAGVVLALGLRVAINTARITVDDPGFQMVVGGTSLQLGLDGGSLLWMFAGVLLITLITAFFSLGRSLRVEPVEAVRETESS